MGGVLYCYTCVGGIILLYMCGGLVLSYCYACVEATIHVSRLHTRSDMIRLHMWEGAVVGAGGEDIVLLYMCQGLILL